MGVRRRGKGPCSLLVSNGFVRGAPEVHQPSIDVASTRRLSVGGGVGVGGGSGEVQWLAVVAVGWVVVLYCSTTSSGASTYDMSNTSEVSSSPIPASWALHVAMWGRGL